MENNAFGGTTALTKTGTGTLTLSGTNTYTGNTTVTAGTLLYTGGSLASRSTDLRCLAATSDFQQHHDAQLRRRNIDLQLDLPLLTPLLSVSAGSNSTLNVNAGKLAVGGTTD